MAESVQEAVQHTQQQSDGELRRLKNLVTRLELEVNEQRSADSRDNPNNVFQAVTKTLARKVGNLANPSNYPAPMSPSNPVSSFNHSTEQLQSGDDYLEQSMKRAQEDVEVLRSLVMPLEEEIKALKDKLRSADDQLRAYAATQVSCL